MVDKIRKRSGEIVDFDENKIRAAIEKALRATNKDAALAAEITEKVAAEINKRFKDRIPGVEDVQDIVEAKLIESKLPETAKAYILYRKERERIRETKKLFGVVDDLKLSVNAVKVLEKRYLLKDDKGNIIETPSQLFRRVAKAIASVEESKNREKWEQIFYSLLASLKFLPNSPTLMNAGTKLGQLSACFVLPVEDSIDGIFTALKYMAIIHKSGGGTGFNFSKLRPEGDVVATTKGIASGPISFMRIFDIATDVIKQGGRRRGANMGVLRYDHPDIVKFITAKEREGFLENFNISVAVEDEFMEKVEKNEDYWLINPRNNEKVKKVNAGDIFELITTQAWKTGDPGMIFLDRINEANPTPELGKIEATNPCITGDTFVITPQGPHMVKELVGKQTKLAVNGKFYSTSREGFFRTGVKKVIKIITDKGYEIKLTEDHLVKCVDRKTRYKIYSSWKKAGEVGEGEEIVLSNNRGLTWQGKGSLEQGYLLGLLLGDGTLKKDAGVVEIWGEKEKIREMLVKAEEAARTLPHRADFNGFTYVSSSGSYRMKLASLRDLAAEFGIFPGNKRVKEELEKTSYDFHVGFLRGIFDADGTVVGDTKKGVSIRLWQQDLGALKIISRMLARLGIISKIYENRKKAEEKSLPDGKNGYKKYRVKAGHELVITNDNILFFAMQIGFSHPEKAKKLKEKIMSYKRKMNRERFVARVKKIESAGYEEVYDVRVPGINAFDANCFYVHNCGEQPLLPYESCNLGSINLSKFVDDKREILYEELASVVRHAVRFLDNVIDANKYPIKEIEEITKGNRKIGLGVMGFAEFLFKLFIAYDSKEALRMAEKIMKFISEEARKASIDLAKEKGSFPNFERSIWHRKYPALRNATVTTVAPTGTISIIANTTSGIEPAFAIAFIRNVMSGVKLLEVNSFFEEVARERGFYSKELMLEIAKKGSIQEISGIPEDIKKVFVTALDIAPEWHVKMQAAFQKHVDNAVSKTVNLPENAKIEDVRKIFMLAYRLKCKGITVYRYGSKSNQVLMISPELFKEPIIAELEYSGGEPTKLACEFCSL